MQEPLTTAYQVEDNAGSITDEFDVDDEYDVESTQRRWPKTTVALLVGVLMAAAFSGGVLVQKRHDSGLIAAGSGLPAGLPAGFAAGAFGGATGAGTGTGTGTRAAASSGPVLVGTVVSVSGTTVTVKDLGGATHTVSTTSTTTVTEQARKTLADLTAGATVAISGTKAADGKVAATAFTIR